MAIDRIREEIERLAKEADKKFKEFVPKTALAGEEVLDITYSFLKDCLNKIEEYSKPKPTGFEGVPNLPLFATSFCEFVNKGTKNAEKEWGSEFWIVNKKEYCGKLLRIDKDHRCSWHWHRDKDETFYVLYGKFEIVYGETDNITEAKRVWIEEGDTFYVPPGLRHSMLALTNNAVLVEISTEHSDEDSIRVIKGY